MPPIDDLMPLIGKQACQVRLDPFQVQLLFDNGGWMVTEHELDQVEPDGSQHRYVRRASDRAPLLLYRLLQTPVAAVEWEELSFTLRFEGNAALVVRTRLELTSPATCRYPERTPISSCSRLALGWQADAGVGMLGEGGQAMFDFTGAFTRQFTTSQRRVCLLSISQGWQ